MAHTRYSTSGKITVANSHPYQFGSIIGAHNGVIYNKDELDKKYGDLEVDSMHIFKAIDEGRDLTEFTGYGTVQYVNLKEPGRVYLARITYSGSLSLAKTKYGIVWSSDNDHLKDALEACGIATEAKGFYKDVDAHTRWIIEDGRLWYTPIEPTKEGEKEKRVELRITPSTRTNPATSGAFSGYTGAHYLKGSWLGHDGYKWEDWDDDAPKLSTAPSSPIATSDAPGTTPVTTHSRNEITKPDAENYAAYGRVQQWEIDQTMRKHQQLQGLPSYEAVRAVMDPADKFHYDAVLQGKREADRRFWNIAQDVEDVYALELQTPREPTIKITP